MTSQSRVCDSLPEKRDTHVFQYEYSVAKLTSLGWCSRACHPKDRSTTRATDLGSQAACVTCCAGPAARMMALCPRENLTRQR